MICLSIAGISYDECLQLAGSEPFVEFRFDLLEFSLVQVQNTVRASNRCIATCRPGTMTGQERIQVLEEAIGAGADFIDLEIESDAVYRENLITRARSAGTEIILSYHNFESTPGPDELNRIVEECSESGADIIKIACQVNQTEDLLNLVQLYRNARRMIVIGMGEKGMISRVAAPFLGAEFTFASMGRDQETAPGQISRDRLNGIYGYLNKENPNKSSIT